MEGSDGNLVVNLYSTFLVEFSLSLRLDKEGTTVLSKGVRDKSTCHKTGSLQSRTFSFLFFATEMRISLFSKGSGREMGGEVRSYYFS